MDNANDGNKAELGLLEALKDFRFTAWVTPTIAKWIYVISFVVIALSLLVTLVAAAVEGGVLGFFGTLIIGVPTAVILLLYARVLLEAIVAVIRIAENTKK